MRSMPIDLLKELGSQCWYCGEHNPVHEKFPDFEANACRSCIRLRRKRTLEEFRLILGERCTVPGVDLQALEAITDKTEEQSQAMEQMLQRTRKQIEEYKFYFEQIAMDFSYETEGTRSINAWNEIKSLCSDELLKQLGSKCWYCGKVLCRYKQDWRTVEIELAGGRFMTAADLAKPTPYYGRPTHDHVGDFTVNACPSCTSRRHRKPIEEYRRWLGVRIMSGAKELQSLEAALQAGVPQGNQERNVVEGMIQQRNAKSQSYRFYVEELLLHCGREWMRNSPDQALWPSTWT